MNNKRQMQIIYTKDFIKSYKKLSTVNKQAVDKTLELFSKNPQNPILRNHSLKGSKQGFKSIDVKFDLRVLFYEEDSYLKIIMLEVGTHSQLYG